jgi:hypothetical protein
MAGRSAGSAPRSASAAATKHRSERTLRLLGSALRRYGLGVVADRRPTPAEEIRCQVRALIVGHLAAEEAPIGLRLVS